MVRIIVNIYKFGEFKPVTNLTIYGVFNERKREGFTA